MLVRGLVLVVGLESLQVVSLLEILPLVLNTGMGGVVALRWRGGTVHGFPFVVLVLLQLERAGSHVVVFVEVAVVGKVFWIVLTPLAFCVRFLEAYDRTQGVVLKSHPGGDKEIHHLWGQWAWACAFRTRD
jgi:hypothetical protein